MSQTNRAPLSARRPTWELIVGGACWIASVEFLIGQAIAQAAWTAPYSLADDTISDLGNTACGVWPPPHTANKLLQRVAVRYYVCSPLHTLMNASFFVTGVLLLLGLYFTRSIWPRRSLTTWGIVFLALAGVGKIVVGLDPENERLFLHSLGALGIPCASIGMLLLGLAIWRTQRRIGVFSVSLGVLGLLGYLALLALSSSAHGVGAAERIADYPMIVWMVGLGVSVIVRPWTVISSALSMQSS